MKKIIYVLAMVVVTFIISSYTNLKQEKTYAKVTQTAAFSIPENIQKILEKSCVGCHNSKSKSKKSKMKFNIDKLTNGKYSEKKIASKLRKIVKLVSLDNEKKMMPPKKFLNKYPERTLTEDEKTVLINWAKEQSL